MHTCHGTHTEVRAQLSGVGSLLHPKIELRFSGLAAETLTIEPPHQLSLELGNAFRYGVTSPCPFFLGECPGMPLITGQHPEEQCQRAQRELKVGKGAENRCSTLLKGDLEFIISL